MPKARAAAKSAGTNDGDLPIDPVSERCVEVLWPVLMTVQSETETTIDEVLYKVRVHVIGPDGWAFGIVMPDCHSQAVGERRMAKPGSRIRYTSGVHRSLLVMMIVVVATGKTYDREIKLGIVKNVELLGGVKGVGALAIIEIGIEMSERGEARHICVGVADSVECEVTPRPSEERPRTKELFDKLSVSIRWNIHRFETLVDMVRTHIVIAGHDDYAFAITVEKSTCELSQKIRSVVILLAQGFLRLGRIGLDALNEVAANDN